MSKHPIPNAALDDRLAFIGTTGAGKTYAAKGAVERILDMKHRVVIVDPLDVWWGLRLKKSGKGTAYDIPIFGGKHGDLPLNEHAGAIVGDAIATSTESCIVALSGLKRSSARERFMLSFLDALYEKTDAERIDPYHVVFDEADLWAPQKPMGNQAMLCHLMEEIVRRGRVKGFIPWLISQRPAVLNKNVLSQADGLVAMSLTSSQDRDAIEAWIEGQADKADQKRVIAELPTLQRGQGILWIPRQHILQTVQFPENGTFDSSRTPKRGEKKHTAVIAPLNIDALKGKLATVEAEVKANDPAAMRKKIAELEAALKKAPKGAATPVPAPAGRGPDAAAQRRAIAAARASGYAEGWNAAGREAQRIYNAVRLAVVKSTTKLATEASNLANVFPEAFTIIAPKDAPAASAEPATAPPAARIQSAAPRPAAALSAMANGDANISGPGRKILGALSWWEVMGIMTPTRTQAAMVAGYPAGDASAFRVPLGVLKADGLVDYPRGSSSLVALTDAGRSAASTWGTPASVGERHRRIFDVLGGPSRKILQVLIDAYPKPMTRDSAALASNYPAGNASAFRVPLGVLKRLELVDYPADGQVVALPVVFQDNG